MGTYFSVKLKKEIGLFHVRPTLFGYIGENIYLARIALHFFYKKNNLLRSSIHWRSCNVPVVRSSIVPYFRGSPFLFGRCFLRVHHHIRWYIGHRSSLDPQRCCPNRCPCVNAPRVRHPQIGHLMRSSTRLSSGMLTCQLMRLDRFSTMSRNSVLVGGPYL